MCTRPPDLHENTVRKPALFPNELMSMVNHETIHMANWDTQQVRDRRLANQHADFTLEEHAEMIMETFENELIVFFGVEYAGGQLGGFFYRGSQYSLQVKHTRVMKSNPTAKPKTFDWATHPYFVSDEMANTYYHMVQAWCGAGSMVESITLCASFTALKAANKLWEVMNATSESREDCIRPWMTWVKHATHGRKIDAFDVNSLK